MDQQIKIESGLPIPEDRRPYPFEKMNVGDSFAIPDERDLNKHGQSPTANRLGAAARGWVVSRGSTAKFSRRCVTENGKRMVRIWRVK